MNRLVDRLRRSLAAPLAESRRPRVGIIGAGQVGGMLAELLARAGHEVAIANSRGPETLRGLAARLGHRVHPAGVAEAAGYGPVAVVAIPFGRYRELPPVAFAGRTVVDAMNYYPERDGHIAELDEGTATSSELLARWLPSAAVVKAFNTIHWSHLREYGRQSSAQVRYGIPVSGDDPAAKRAVLDLVEQFGFEPVDAGGLADGGRRHQPGTPVYGVELTAEQLRAALMVRRPG